VVELFGLAGMSVSAYQRRHLAMPRAIGEFAEARRTLSLRGNIEGWRSERLAGSGR
jgi:hypothetical protein